MTEEHDNFTGGGSDSISDETIRRCLLGSALADEQAKFEEFLLVDDEMEKRVRLAEFELVDDFSFERLEGDERELFISNFLVTEERGQRVAVSRALRRALAGRMAEKSAVSGIQPEVGKGTLPLRQTKGSSETQSRQSKVWGLINPGLFRPDHPAVSFGLAFVALVLFGGLFWLLMKSQRVHPPVVVKRPTAPSPDRQSHHPGGSQSPPRTPESAITPTQSAPVAILTLRPGVPSDEKQSVHFTTQPAEKEIVRLELLLESSEPANYHAELLTSGGQQITVASELTSVTANQQMKLVWDVPASLLRAANYQVVLRLVNGGQAQEVGRYSFSVR